MKIKFRTAFWTTAGVGLLILLALAFRPRAIAVDTAQVVRGPMTVTVRDEARTRVRNEYVVRAPVSGQLLRVPVKPGDNVHGGQVIARILPADPQFLDARTRAELAAGVRSAEATLAVALADRARAEAEVAYARTEAERADALRAQGLTSQEMQDRMRLQLRVAQATLETARESVRMREAEVSAARVRLEQPGGIAASDAAAVEVAAPISGRVLQVLRESEGVIAAAEEIMTVGDPRDLEVVAELLSTDAVQVEPGAAVLIEDWGREGTVLRGRVRLVEPYGFLKISALGVEEQRVNVIIDFVDPPEQWSMLGHGYRVEAAIVTWEAEDVVRVPVAALFRSNGQWAAFRIEDGRARMTPVEVGRDNGRDAEIVSGLDPGTTVVLYPGEQLVDGARLEPRPEPRTGT